MARARNIKPSFFSNEELVELPFSTRLLFIGLWTLADREGRLEDKPKRIKMSLFPADNIDVDAALTELEKAKFLLRYEHGGDRFIQVLTFSKHQNPHRDEKASTIPAHEKHCANTVQGQCTDDSSTVLISLIPDSLPLIPEIKTVPQADSADAQKFDFYGELAKLDVDSKVIAAWMKVRKSKKATNSEIALDALKREAKKAGLSVADAVLICAERSWAGLEADWLKPKSHASPSRTSAHIGFEKIDYRAGVNEDGSF